MLAHDNIAIPEQGQNVDSFKNQKDRVFKKSACVLLLLLLWKNML